MHDLDGYYTIFRATTHPALQILHPHNRIGVIFSVPKGGRETEKQRKEQIGRVSE